MNQLFSTLSFCSLQRQEVLAFVWCTGGTRSPRRSRWLCRGVLVVQALPSPVPRPLKENKYFSYKWPKNEANYYHVAVKYLCLLLHAQQSYQSPCYFIVVCICMCLMNQWSPSVHIFACTGTLLIPFWSMEASLTWGCTSMSHVMIPWGYTSSRRDWPALQHAGKFDTFTFTCVQGVSWVVEAWIAGLPHVWMAIWLWQQVILQYIIIRHQGWTISAPMPIWHSNG